MLDFCRRRASGEDEPQVTVTLGQGDHGSTGRDADLKADHPVDGQGLGLTGHLLEHPGGPDGKHHHPRGLDLPAQTVEPGAYGVAHDDLFEAYPGPETQRPGAQAADGTGRHLDDHGPTMGPDAQFGVHRAFSQPQ